MNSGALHFQGSASSMPDLITILFIGLAALGIVLLLRGWRGKRVDNHPWCRKCRFDLNGVWPGAAKCPECGVNLERIDAVELGQRHRRPILAGLGIVMLLCCAGWLGLGVWRAAGLIRWADYKPDWWLVREACSGDAETSQIATAALWNRIKDHTVSDAHIAQLTEHALAVQGDEDTPWNIIMGEIILNAWIDGSLTPDQALQFAQRAVTFTLDPGGPLVRQWEIATLKVQPRALRAAAGECRVRLTPKQGFIGDTPMLLDTSDISDVGVRMQAGSRAASRLVPIVVEPGEYELRMTFLVEMSPSNSGLTAAAWDIQLSAPLKVLPPAEDAAELVMGEQADATLLDAFKFQAVGLRLHTAARGRAGSTILLFATVDEAPISADLDLSVATNSSGPDRGSQVQAIFGSSRSMPAPILIGQSYRSRWEISGNDDSTSELVIHIAPKTNRLSRPGPSPWDSQRMWYGLALSTGPIAVPWYDSIDDPNLPAALRELCLQPEGWRSLAPAMEGEKAQP